jgi:hypothetical protein
MNALPDWSLYAGALVLVVIALRMAGGFSRSDRSTSLHARTKKKSKKAGSSRGREPAEPK